MWITQWPRFPCGVTFSIYFSTECTGEDGQLHSLSKAKMTKCSHDNFSWRIFSHRGGYDYRADHHADKAGEDYVDKADKEGDHFNLNYAWSN